MKGRESTWHTLGLQMHRTRTCVPSHARWYRDDQKQHKYLSNATIIRTQRDRRNSRDPLYTQAMIPRPSLHLSLASRWLRCSHIQGCKWSEKAPTQPVGSGVVWECSRGSQMVAGYGQLAGSVAVWLDTLHMWWVPWGEETLSTSL